MEERYIYADNYNESNVYFDDYDDSTLPKRKYTFHQRSKGQLLVCQFCRKEFKYPSKYKEHLRTHTGERPYKCSQCPLTFTQSGARKAHERLHSETGGHVCEVCGRIFRSKGLLQKHLRSHDPPTVFEPQPLYISQSDSQVYYQQSVKTEGVMNEQVQYIPTYDIVEYGFIEPDEVEATHKWQVDHIPSVSHDGGVEQDSELHLTRLSDGRLLVNEEVVEGHYLDNGLTIYTIQLSNGQVMNFLYDEANDSLEIVEPSEEPQIIEHAVEEYPSSSNQEILHEYNDLQLFDELLQNQIESDDPYSPTVDEVLENKKHDVKPLPELIEPPLTDNGVILADSRPPTNKLSEKDATLVPVDKNLVLLAAPIKQTNVQRIRFKKPQNLEWVINAVAMGKEIDDATPHKRRKPTIKTCEYCGLTLKYPSKIEAHLRTHTGEKPFECDICHHKFALRTTLRMHLRRHLKQKAFVCTFENCNKAFVCAALLRHHIKVRHTARRKFACLRRCGASFYTNKDREKHEQTCLVMDLENPICEFPEQEEIMYDDKFICFEGGEQQYTDQWDDGVDLLQHHF